MMQDAIGMRENGYKKKRYSTMKNESNSQKKTTKKGHFY